VSRQQAGRRVIFIASSLAILLVGQVASAQAPASVQQLDEVTVEGQRLYQMRQRIVAAEERFYALYNELNKNDEFDVHCANEAPLGTRLRQRVCRANFIATAEAEFAVSFVAQLAGEAGGGSAKQPALVALEREPEYKATMLKVVTAHPELLRLLLERNKLEDLYNAARRKRFKRP